MKSIVPFHLTVRGLRLIRLARGKTSAYHVSYRSDTLDDRLHSKSDFLGISHIHTQILEIELLNNVMHRSVQT